MPVPAGLRAAVTAAIARTDTAWALNRPKAMDRTRAAVMAAIEPLVSHALDEAYADGEKRGYIEGTHQGQALGRSQALLEVETMLKRHGHRSAVTRVQGLADAADAALVATETPARPQPVNDSPAGGPGRTAPDSDGVAPEPTEPANGAQRGAQGLAEAWERYAEDGLTHG